METTREDLQDRFLPTAIYRYWGSGLLGWETRCGFHAVEMCIEYPEIDSIDFVAAPLSSACAVCGGTLESLNS